MPKDPLSFVSRDEVESLVREHIQKLTNRTIRSTDIEYGQDYYHQSDRYFEGISIDFLPDKCSTKARLNKKFQPCCCQMHIDQWKEKFKDSTI